MHGHPAHLEHVASDAQETDSAVPAAQVLWSGLMAKRGLPLHKGSDVSTVISMSEGYSAGRIEQVIMPIAHHSRSGAL